MSSRMVWSWLMSMSVVACGGSDDSSSPASGGASGAGGSTGGAGGVTTGGSGGTTTGGSGGTTTGGSGGTTSGGSGGSSTGGTGGATGGAGGSTGGAAGASGGAGGTGGGGPVSCNGFPSTVPLNTGYVPAYKSAYLCFTNAVQLTGTCTLETGLSPDGCLNANEVHLEFRQCQAGNPQCQTGSQAVWTKPNSGLQMAQTSAGFLGLNGSLTGVPANTDVTLQLQSAYNSGEFYTVVFTFDGANHVTIKSFQPDP